MLIEPPHRTQRLLFWVLPVVSARCVHNGFFKNNGRSNGLPICSRCPSSSSSTQELANLPSMISAWPQVRSCGINAPEARCADNELVGVAADVSHINTKSKVRLLCNPFISERY